MSEKFLPGAGRYYSAAQERQAALRGMTWQERLVERANDVSIFDVLRDYFGLNLPRDGESYKTHCPFGFEHGDGGMDKGFRTYPGTNSAMCFPMHGFLTPTRLIQLKFQEKPASSAERILRNYDLFTPRPWRERYQSLMLAQETRVAEAVGNPQYAVSALGVFLRSLDDYSMRQFDSDVIQAMEVLLDRLNDVSHDPSAVREWLDQAKKIMTKLMGAMT